MSSALEVGKKLVDLCKQGKGLEAIDKLYDKNIVSIEAMSSPAMPAKMEGISAIREKNDWWYKNHEVHSAEVKGPWPNGDRFAVYFKYEVTATSGKMKGQRFAMEETALYTVKGDKIIQEEFFYHMGG
jgi:hypothetical protein